MFFQSDFCLCIVSNSRHAQIRKNKMADSNYFLLPTRATDCTNLHANDHIYYTGGIAKHRVPLIADCLYFCYKKKKKKNDRQTLQSPNSAAINTQDANMACAVNNKAVRVSLCNLCHFASIIKKLEGMSAVTSPLTCLLYNHLPNYTNKK